jgi:uncharacterized protein (TIGR02588 family)
MPRPALEWICGTLGGLLVVATLATVALQIPGNDDRAPPVLRVQVTGVTATLDGHLARFVLVNPSEATAAAVQVEGRLLQGEQVVETSHVTLDYAPRGSSTRGGLWFSRDPACCTLSIRPLGYQEP